MIQTSLFDEEKEAVQEISKFAKWLKNLNENSASLSLKREKYEVALNA